MGFRYSGGFCGPLEFGFPFRYFALPVVSFYIHVSWGPRYFYACPSALVDEGRRRFHRLLRGLSVRSSFLFRYRIK